MKVYFSLKPSALNFSWTILFHRCPFCITRGLMQVVVSAAVGHCEAGHVHVLQFRRSVRNEVGNCTDSSKMSSNAGSSELYGILNIFLVCFYVKSKSLPAPWRSGVWKCVWSSSPGRRRGDLWIFTHFKVIMHLFFCFAGRKPAFDTLQHWAVHAFTVGKNVHHQLRLILVVLLKSLTLKLLVLMSAKTSHMWPCGYLLMGSFSRVSVTSVLT